MTIHAVQVSAGRNLFADTQIVQYALTVEVRRARFITAPHHGVRHIKVIIHAADCIDQLLDRGHRDRIVIVHRNAAQHPARRLASLQESGAAGGFEPAAAVNRGVDLVNTFHAGYLCVGIARDRDQIHAILIKVDRHDHHDVRVIFVFAAPGFTLLRVVHADEQHVDDVLHHGRVRLRADHLVRIERRRWRWRREIRSRGGGGRIERDHLRLILLCVVRKLRAGIEQQRIRKHTADRQQKYAADKQHRPERALLFLCVSVRRAHMRGRKHVCRNKRLYFHAVIIIFGLRFSLRHQSGFLFARFFSACFFD